MLSKSKEAEAKVDELRRAILQHELTHRKVAEKLGVTTATLSRWLNGHMKPTSDHTLKTITQFLQRL